MPRRSGSLAAITNSAASAARSPARTSPPKSAYPGVSSRLTLVPRARGVRPRGTPTAGGPARAPRSRYTVVPSVTVPGAVDRPGREEQGLHEGGLAGAVGPDQHDVADPVGPGRFEVVLRGCLRACLSAMVQHKTSPGARAQGLNGPRVVGTTGSAVRGCGGRMKLASPRHRRRRADPRRRHSPASVTMSSSAPATRKRPGPRGLASERLSPRDVRRRGRRRRRGRQRHQRGRCPPGPRRRRPRPGRQGRPRRDQPAGLLRRVPADPERQGHRQPGRAAPARPPRGPRGEGAEHGGNAG